MESKYIGLILALVSSLLIGSSFVLTKLGLKATSEKYGSATKGLAYIRNYVWWIGMIAMASGEVANFAAYTFAPAILVTPLGALSVIFGAIFASIFLGEKISTIGKCGCALCLLGALQVVTSSPQDPVINSIDEILAYVIKPGFLIYASISLTSMLVLIKSVAPKFGKQNPITYLAICSIAGSFTVIACKGFGIAIKLTFSGSNQFTHIATYFFMVSILVCIALQMTYFNKALAIFDANIVIPIYYVFFTTATILATIILFQGFSGTVSQFIVIFSGFFTLFIGVFLLNFSRLKTSEIVVQRDEEDDIDFTRISYLNQNTRVELTPDSERETSTSEYSLRGINTPLSLEYETDLNENEVNHNSYNKK
ncbi:hypothetical protein BB559_000773 [Furculomyces boomerangus]|uniref:DUF803-domain-containing protein n=2 Tax=Harpellales TaxID=61421 RepID=A0A2T9Z4A7_9FUNG|nr:hypothetical protein BB559_000773 [Furculomyces boomerangus]PVZ98753.1 hypothetical protein BB558_005229 [Smittium angustum]PWA03225.1 hypothetical protein BB558_000561 [Smittium angustum]